jgi:hypothetical protein
MRNLFWTTAVLAALGLTSCEHPVTLETRLKEDGSAARSVIFEKTDSSVLRGNMFGAAESKDWKVTVKVNEGESSSDRYRIQFDKEFASVEEMNTEMDTGSDTLFHIRSSWEKSFRWFYTSIRYEETYRSINRFRLAPAEDFINNEDRQFIQRLPPEGSKLPKSDSVFLRNLDAKINDQYAEWAIGKEQIEILTKLINRSGLDPRWLDTLKKHQDVIYRSIEEDQDEQSFVLRMADTLHIPLPERASRWADSLSAEFNARLRFMSYARDSHFLVVCELPWAVVETNADSVAGNRAFWRPRVHNFMFGDYTLYAEARTPNFMAIVVGILLMTVTLVVFFRKGIKRNRL